VLFFRARNGTLKRVPQLAQSGMEGTQGGMVREEMFLFAKRLTLLTLTMYVVYYMSDALFDTAQKSSVTAFKPGFRMLVGDVSFRDRNQSRAFRQLSYTCMDSQASRSPETVGFPDGPCKLGIMANHRFPTCWDGVNLDSPNHQDHVAYPESGTFESGGPCPSTHPVHIPQLMLETVWDTSAFNNKADWPADNSQPFVWSSGDQTGYSSHADYLFGWQGDSLQKAMDGHTYVSAPMLKTQSIAGQNKCIVKDMVNENYDGCRC
jgi:hypothetical protein